MKINAKSSCAALRQSKRIYLNMLEFQVTCPQCQETILYKDDSPILTQKSDDQWYCHHLYCVHCDFESDKPFYQLKGIGESHVDLVFDKQFDIKVFEIVVQKKQVAFEPEDRFHQTQP